MDRPRPRHVDRRDQGLRRQRLVTQSAAFGAAALAVAFGWAFVQPQEAPAVDPAGSTEQQETTTPAPTKSAKGTAKTGTAKNKAPATQKSDDAQLQPPEQAPEQAPEASGSGASDARSGGS